MKRPIPGTGIIVRGSVFALTWWVLTDGVAASWWIGVPAIMLALTVSVVLVPPTRLNGVEMLKFVPFFLLRSLQGGADVAWRAIHPGMPIAPELISYSLRLPPGLPQVLMANTVSLLPGTLSAALDHGVLQVHVLDRQQDILAELEALELTVARLFYLSEDL